MLFSCYVILCSSLFRLTDFMMLCSFCVSVLLCSLTTYTSGFFGCNVSCLVFFCNIQLVKKKFKQSTLEQLPKCSCNISEVPPTFIIHHQKGVSWSKILNLESILAPQVPCLQQMQQWLHLLFWLVCPFSYMVCICYLK